MVDPTRRQSPRRACTVAEIAVGDKYAVVGGPFGSKLVTKDYTETGVPVLRGGNLPFDRKIDLSDVVFVSEAKVKEDLFGNLAFPGDIVVTQRGTLGQVGFLPLEGPYDCYVISQSQMKLSVDRTKADPRFIYWYFRLPAVRKTFENLGSSSGVPHINLETFRSFELLLPNLVEQGLIATVLDSFDDLIENNRRRIELLEETARLLYREWFVHFRYPGHEDVALVDSEFGSRPEDWSHTTLGEISELSRTAANPSEIPPLSPVLSLGDLPYRSTTLHDWDSPEAAGSRKAEFKSGDILFAKLDPGSHKAVWAPIDGFCSTDILAFRATQPQFASLILSVVSSDHFVAVAAKTANGTTHIRVSPDVLLSYPVPLPPPAILDEFDQVVSPMVRLCSHLAVTNRCLREARNLLLPRLVSGDLDISDLDLSLEAVG